MDQNFNNQNNNQPNDYQNQYNQYNQSQQNNYQNQYSQPQQNNYQNQYSQPQQNNYQTQYNQPQTNDYQSQYNYPQQYNQQDYTQQYPQYTQPADNSAKNMGVASLVLGIISVLCCGGGGIFAIVGIILGAMSRSKSKENNGIATAGLIVSIASLVIGIIVGVVYFVAVIAGSASADFYY